MIDNRTENVKYDWLTPCFKRSLHSCLASHRAKTRVHRTFKRPHKSAQIVANRFDRIWLDSLNGRQDRQARQADCEHPPGEVLQFGFQDVLILAGFSLQHCHRPWWLLQGLVQDVQASWVDSVPWVRWKICSTYPILHFIHFCISGRRERLIGFCAGKPLCESLELRTGKSLLRASLLASRVATLASRVPGLQCLLVIQIANMHFAFSQFLLQLSGSVWTGATTLNGGGLYLRPSMDSQRPNRSNINIHKYILQ